MNTITKPTEMTNNKQQTAIDIAELAMKLYPFSNSERNAFITGYNKAKEIEKEIMIQFCIDWFISREMNIREYYEQTYGGTKL
jgi:hypothetical protein